MFRFSIFNSFIFFCFAILFLSSCDEITNEFGSDLELDDPVLQTLFTDTVTVKTKIIKIDSVNTSIVTRLLVGSVEDPVLGTYAAESYVKFIAEKDSIDFRNDEGKEAIYDSLILSLPIDYEYGDTLLNQTLQVVQLEEGIVDSLTYYQFSTLPVKSNGLLGSFNYPQDLDTSKVFHVKLSDELGRQMIEKGSGGDVLTKENLQTFFKGIKLSSTTKNGTVLGFNLSDFANIDLKLYFHYEGDTLASDTSFFFVKRFHNIKSDFSGTGLEGLTSQNPISSNLMNNLCVAQAGTGITTHITFPYIKEFDDFTKGTGASVAIHRVELFLVPDVEKTTNLLPPPTSLIFLNPDEDGKTTIIDPVSNETGRQNITLVYDAGGRVYNEQSAFPNPNALLTTYMAGIIDVDHDNFGIILAVNQNNQSVNRVIFNDNQSLVDKKLALRIYYTVVK